MIFKQKTGKKAHLDNKKSGRRFAQRPFLHPPEPNNGKDV